VGIASVLAGPADAVARAVAFAGDPARLATVRRTGLLDAGLQESLQRYTRLAAKLTGSPISTVSVIDADRQYFSGAFGTEVEQTPLESSYCKHPVADGVQLCVEDSLSDEILAANGATLGMGIRAYLGSPFTAGGSRIGALCVIDQRPRAWTDDDREIIDDLAMAVATDIELRLQLTTQREMAITDPLTGLGNRRALAAALDDVHHRRGRAFVGMFDLDGFKAYNDAFGHPAGDDLLVRIAGRLSGVCQDRDAVFRMGGDEFCMISNVRENLLAARRVIEDRGPGFCISASLGVANIPDDAVDGTAAIDIADRRMYTSKAARPSSVDHQVTNVLLRTLAERNGPLGGHSANVSKLACQIAEKFAVGEETMQAIELASRLHDIGKMAISDQILHKPGPLTPDEWKQMRAHTLIGERIIATAPSLAEAARLVRFSHERYDGGGYPDGLPGEQIPLGARIIFACDAYDAMTSDRSYRRALSEAEACTELQRHAGTQFDPRVVHTMISSRLAAGLSA
jgi:diguanylate cyclase (GGDEF)-like protein